MECISKKTNSGLMGNEEDESLSPIIEYIEKNRPLSDYPGAVHEAIDDILQFMRAAVKGIGESGQLYSNTHEQMWRGAGSILEIAALLQRRLWQHSEYLLMERLEGAQKIKAVSGAKG